MTTPSLDNGHVPVLLDRAITALAPRAGETMVDATFGGGGYSAGLLDAADCCVLALDRGGGRRGRLGGVPVTSELARRPAE